MPLRPASRGSLAAAGGAWLVRFSRARRGGTEARRSRHWPRRLLCSDSCPSARSVTDHVAQATRPLAQGAHHLSNLRALCCREVCRPPAQLTQLTLPLRVELRPHCRRLGPRELIQPRTVISQSICQPVCARSVRPYSCAPAARPRGSQAGAASPMLLRSPRSLAPSWANPLCRTGSCRRRQRASAPGRVPTPHAARSCHKWVGSARCRTQQPCKPRQTATNRDKSPGIRRDHGGRSRALAWAAGERRPGISHSHT